MSSRWVMVDDADPAVQWGPNWFASQGIADNLGNWGAPFEKTLHGTNINASVAFSFTGTSILVSGSLRGIKDVGVSGKQDPSWECILDGQTIPKTSSANQNHCIFCAMGNLADGPHTFTFNAKVGTLPLFVDQFQYMASPGVNIDNAKVQVDFSNPDIRYSSGWDRESFYTITYQTGESVVVDFIGVSVQWYGYVPNVDSRNGRATAGYRIDGGTESNFTLAGIPTGTSAFYNVLFFKTPPLPPGRHQLEVVHYGNNETTPLTLDYLFIQNATLPSTTTSGLPLTSAGPGSVSSTTSNSSSTGTGTQTEKSTPVGAIVGGVIGGLAVLVLLGIFLLLFLRHHRKHRGRLFDLNNDISDVTQSEPLPDPYTQDGPDQSTFTSPNMQDSRASLRSWHGSQNALPRAQSPMQFQPHSQSQVQLQTEFNPYLPIQLASPQLSGPEPDILVVTPPEYRDVAPIRNPGAIPTSEKLVVLNP